MADDSTEPMRTELPDPGQPEAPMSIYQKTGAALRTTGEKATGLFAGIGAKLSEARESATFKSMEDRVGTMVTSVKSKVGNSRSNSTQSFDEALKEAEAAKKQQDDQQQTVQPQQ